MGYWGFPKYVSVGEKRVKAKKKLKQLKKKNPGIKPIIIEGKAIAKTWWGKEWNKNLERYADYSNRIGRGRSYVRHMAVLDLQIKPGEVKSLVQGSASKPYSVNVKISTMPGKNWGSIKKACKGKLDSLRKLLAGKFPKAFNDIFTAKGKGLFPAPEEIEFSCSCPDWAYMCKHVAATLYGIGARLDEDPTLFFKLRKVKVNDLISEAVEDSARNLLEKAKKRTARVMDDSNLSDVFGIDLDEETDSEVFSVAPSTKSSTPKNKPEKKKRKRKSNTKKTITKAPAKKPKKVKKAQTTIAVKKKTVTPLKKKTLVKKPAKNPKTDVPAIDVVEKIIKRSKKGIGIPVLIQKTGFEETKIRNIVFRLRTQGRIENRARGIYIAP
jgi:uncharacterized Zn finger protein